MSNLIAFKLPNGGIIAAASAFEAVRIADATPVYAIRNIEVDDVRPCNDKELDMPRTYGNGDRPAPTVRQRLNKATEACHLLIRRPSSW